MNFNLHSILAKSFKPNSPLEVKSTVHASEWAIRQGGDTFVFGGNAETGRHILAVLIVVILVALNHEKLSKICIYIYIYVYVVKYTKCYDYITTTW